MMMFMFIVLVGLLILNGVLVYRLSSILERLEVTLTDFDILYTKTQQLNRKVNDIINH